jgi:hypothetical protein
MADRSGESAGPALIHVEPRRRRTRVQLFADIFWGTWLAMLVVGDPILNFAYGEQYSDTHFLVTHISVGLRAGILGWVTYHFLVTHVRR